MDSRSVESPRVLKVLNDDPEGIPDEEILYRIILPAFVKDGRPSSQGFQDYPEVKAAEYGLAGPCASVALVSVWRAKGADLEALIEQFDKRVGVVRFLAGAARTLQGRGGGAFPQGFMKDPTERSPWHAVMFDLSGLRGQAARKAMPSIVEWVYRPGELETLVS